MLTLILKGTDGCNLNCAYCSLGEKLRHDTVSPQMLKKILEYAFNVCQQRDDSQIEIVLHGGEPTLVPVKVYDEAMQYVQKKFPEIKAGISMQTNAFNVSHEYLSFLQRYDVNIGVSIDGSAQIHNQERRSKSGQDTFAVVAKNIKRMQSAGLRVSGLMVLTSVGVAAPLDYLKDFASAHIHLKINPLLNYGEAIKNPELAIKKGDYANYLIRVYEYIIANGVDASVSPIDKILQAILRNDNIWECTFNANCINSFLCVDCAGDIYPCGKYSDIHGFKLGNVLSQTQDVLNTSPFRQLKERRTCKLPKKCRECKYIDICHAGCSAEAYIEKSFDEPPFLCEDYQMLFEYFCGKGLLLLREQLVEKKRLLSEEPDGI